MGYRVVLRRLFVGLTRDDVASGAREQRYAALSTSGVVLAVLCLPGVRLTRT